MVIADLFGPWGQVIVYSTIAIAVVIALLIIACFVTPGCIGYECIRPRKEIDKTTPLKHNGKANEGIDLSDISYRSWRVGSLYETDTNGVIPEILPSPRDSLNSSNSQFDPIDTSSVVNLVQPPKQKNGTKTKEFPTECTLSLRYLPYCEGITSSKLVIGVEAISGLPPKPYNCSLEPYVVLNVIKNSWTLRQKQRLYDFKTKEVKNTANPVFRESFVISGVTSQEIKEWIINVEAYDYDRHANHTKLCELQVPLKDAKRIFLTPETHLFNFQMKPSKQEYGNMLLGVSYLPTAQRLTINVMKSRNIKLTSSNTKAYEFNPYVRVVMLNGKTGRRMKKKKTRCIAGSAEPEFNETLTFDLPATQIDTLQFLIVLCNKTMPDDNNSSMMSEIQSDGESSVSSYQQKPKDTYIGKIALGRGVRGMTERLHWFSVLQNPRKLVTVWHTLK